MKPLCLTIQAFGPYAERQTIDFADLKGRSFFLIHGPTGSGKTTVLDAICFALYGDCSGAIRESKAMRSDYAAAEVMTTIDFVFALGADTYQISRTPEQLRPKKRGEGFTAMLAEAELYQLEGNERKLLVSGWSKVTEKVEELLGFKSNQFRQVVLLPQGEFRRLLTANSAERQEIMQALFKTDVYRQLEETLKSQAQTIKKDYEEISKEAGWILKEAQAEAVQELAVRLQEYQAEREKTVLELKTAASEQQRVQTSLAEGTMQQKKLTEKVQAEAKLAELQEKVLLVEEKQRELAKAKQAASIIDIENMLNQLGEDCRIALDLTEKAEGAFLLAQTAHDKAAELFELERKKEPEREKAAEEVLRLQELEGKLAALTKADEALQERKSSLVEAEKQHALELKKLEKVQIEVKYNVEESQRLVELAMLEEKYKAQYTEVSQQIMKLQEYKEAEAKWQKAKGQLKEAAAASELITKRHEAAKAALAALQEAWLGGQAAVMAAGLKSGNPCPVCGALEHPKLAIQADVLLDEAKVKAQQKNVEVLEKEREASFSAFGKLQTAHDTLYNRVQDLKGQLGDAAVKSIDMLEEAVALSKAEYQKALQAKEQVEKIKGAVEKLTVEEVQLAKLCEQAVLELQTMVWHYQAALAVVVERKSLVPTEFHEPAVLAKAQQAAKAQLSKLKAALEAAKAQKEQADRQRITSQAALENAKHNLAKLSGQEATMQKTFGERLTEAGFTDVREYQNAKKSPAYIEKLAERITIFEQEFIAAKERVRLAAEAAQNLVPPDLAALQHAVTETQKKYEEHLAQDTRLKAQVEQVILWQEKLVRLAEKRSKIEGEYAVIGRLAEVANGGNEYKLTFQRFVLGALLEDVAHAANQRLLIMSRGRYELQRTMDRARKNAAGGLELEVFDSYTGVARGIGTLSGGEMFLASLSLALGLADVVQSYAGGIKLDTILVDEGFGTLDPESLDIALKALLDLQKGGRLVGIISHVPELKERIDARLEVKLTDKGSRAEFKVG